MRINLGAGPDRKPGWVNVDDGTDDEWWQEQGYADIAGEVVNSDALTYLRSLDDASADEIYAGHLLEHFERTDGLELLQECRRVLKQGGKIGIVVPDTDAVLRRCFTGRMDLDEACELFLYSTVQPSRHKWSYSLKTLGRLLIEAGFEIVSEIDRHEDERLVQSAWYQCGLEATR